MQIYPLGRTEPPGRMFDTPALICVTCLCRNIQVFCGEELRGES